MENHDAKMKEFREEMVSVAGKYTSKERRVMFLKHLRDHVWSQG